MDQPERLLQFFAYDEAVPETIIGAPFRDFANHLVGSLPPSAERTLALRNLMACRDESTRAYKGKK